MTKTFAPKNRMAPTRAQNAAKRMDRFMSLVISSGGLIIILAVMGILFFIGKEAIPLFSPSSSKQIGQISMTAPDGLWLEESGKVALIADPAQGLRAVRLSDGQVLTTLVDGPTLPWRYVTLPSAKGELIAMGADGRLSLGKLGWDKPAGEQDPVKWTPTCAWSGALSLPSEIKGPLHWRAVEGSGLGGGQVLKLAVVLADGLTWTEAPLDGSVQANYKVLPLPESLTPSALAWNQDGSQLYVGTKEGRVLDFEMGAEPTLLSSSDSGEPVTALGFAFGQNSLLVGGERGGITAYQQVRKNEVFNLQPFHHLEPLPAAVLGFMSSQRDKRFLSWSSKGSAVDHLTSERRLWSGPGADHASLAPRGDAMALASPQGIRTWSLDAPHPEISWRTLWGKVHYEGYEKPDYVWQSSGGTDDFEPKFSLTPLLFGTLKGTLYALLFAIPLAIFGAIYTSQFATPRLRNAIKPTVEVMAALPSVVLGFLAGLVLAPLFERSAISVLLVPPITLLFTAACMPMWGMLPQKARRAWGEGREAMWMIPVLLMGLLLAIWIAPSFERIFMGGSYRGWLLEHFQIRYDQRNSIVVGFAMGFAVIPIIFTISEDALSSVPKSLTSASLACGASPWQTAWRVVLPTASPGIFSAVMVGLGRAIGETMIVLMATGNTPIMDWSPFNGMRTLAANIAVEIPEAPHHSTLYRVLFLAALLLFAFTFLLNTAAELVRQHLRKKYENF